MNLLLVLLALAAAPRQSAAPTAPAPATAAASEQPLQAIFIEVDGKARWRADDKADWRDAKVNDLVSAGAEIRTGLKGRAALRVGKNATVLIDSGTTFQLPTIVQEGETLRTLAAVKSGRVDFKVDKVGFANDFKVLTPQTTLAVRGTGFGVSSGPLTGVEVVGARTNMINAIELRYVTQNVRYFLSGSATSSTSRKDPVRNAWLSTIGPPQVAGTIVDAAQLEQTAAQGQAGNAPTSAQMFQQIAAAQTEQQAGDSVQDLLRLEEEAAGRSNAASGATLLAAGVASGSAGPTLTAVQDRNEHIGEAVQAGEELEAAWSGGSGGSGGPQSVLPGAEARLEELVAQGVTDQAALAARRGELESAIVDGDEAQVVAKLEAIGAIGDAWHDTVKVEAANIVANLLTLNSQIEQAYEFAQQKDTTFNALLPDAERDALASQGLAATLDGLRDAVRRYQAAVAEAVRSGQASKSTIAQFLRSVEILREVERRTTAALLAAGSASELLRNARSLSERVLLAAAFTAFTRSEQIRSQADSLKSDIDSRAASIEVARFEAFFSSAEAGLDAIDEGSALALAESDAILPIAAEVPGKAAIARPLLEASLAASNSLDTFWEGTSGDGGSRKARMEQLAAQSATDRALVATDLGKLNDSIALDDRSGADLFLDEMKTTHDAWWTPQTGLVFEAQGINDEMVSRMGSVESAWQTADSSYDQVQSLLGSAESRRAAAAAAANRIQAIKTRMEQYQAQYLALANAGRGGEGALARVQAGITALSGLEATYLAGVAASAEAAARVETARSNAERVLYSAASDAYLRALGQAGASAAAMATIQSNAELLRDDYNDGQDAYNAKFPPGK